MPLQLKTMLVIDDDTSIFRSIRCLFAGKLNVLHAPTVQTALHLLEREEIDICLVDYILPDGDGLEVLKTIHDLYPYIPAVFLSGYLNREVENKAPSFEYGAYRVLSKPFDPNEFVKKVMNDVEKGGKAWAYYILKKYKEKHPGMSDNQKHKVKREKRLDEILLRIKNEPGKWTSGMLAPMYEVEPRQIQYDIQTLKARGHRIQTSGRRYILDEEKNNAKC
ncbi:MAG: response regulator [Candidatus Omnitrophota bacterium]|jgi:DNA-binding NtrC family response regulator|nr:MAG: response regulator [Candidatus Omnitrophota bacterium]